MAGVNKLQKANNLSQVSEMISKGIPRNEVLAYIENTIGMTKRSSVEFYREALRDLIMDDDFLGDYKKAVQTKNYDRLEKIIEDTINGNTANKKVAIQAIGELNRMIGTSGNQVTIGKNGENEIIHITFEH